MLKLSWVRQTTRVICCCALLLGLRTGAFASCGDSLLALASGKAVVSSPAAALATASPAGSGKSSSIVGMWYTQFIINGQTIQEAFQNWNRGGTEVHNPNVDPRTGNVCLGTWATLPGGGFKLAHRVWSYDTEGNFLGIIYLTETIHLTQKGAAHTGEFKLHIYDPTGKFVTEVAGDVSAQRIQVE